MPRIEDAINRLSEAIERRNAIEERWLVECDRHDKSVRYRCLPAWVRHAEADRTKREMTRIEITDRQLQYCIWVARGFADKQVAKHLGVSIYTVKETLRQLYKKFDVPDRRELIASLLVQGTLTTDMIAGLDE